MGRSIYLCAVLFIVGVVPNVARGQLNYQPFFIDPIGRGEEAAIEGGGIGSVSNFQRLPGIQSTSAVIADPTFGFDAPFDLVAPANPNLLFGNEVSPSLGLGFATEGGLPVIYGKTKVAAQVAIPYDTGYVGSGIQLFPSSVALDGTALARRRGQTQMSADGTQLLLSLEPNTVSSSAKSFRSDFRLDFFDGIQLQIASAQVELGPGTLYGGKTWSTFMDEYAVPISVSANTTAAGAVYKRIVQLGYAMPLHGGWRAFMAIEDPKSDDYTLVTATDERINRYPNLVARLHWASSRDWATNSTFHIAALWREMGLESPAFVEDFENGWGVCAMGKIRPSCTDTFYAGTAFGEGVGDYIFGFDSLGPAAADNMPAAGPFAGQLGALRNVGAYCGYTKDWNPGACRLRSVTNFGYGYAYTESSPLMPATAARRLQNAWVNHQVKLTEVVALGFEYHYALREVRDGTEGDTHRIMLLTQILTK